MSELTKLVCSPLLQFLQYHPQVFVCAQQNENGTARINHYLIQTPDCLIQTSEHTIKKLLPAFCAAFPVLKQASSLQNLWSLSLLNPIKKIRQLYTVGDSTCCLLELGQNEVTSQDNIKASYPLKTLLHKHIRKHCLSLSPYLVNIFLSMRIFSYQQAKVEMCANKN